MTDPAPGMAVFDRHASVSGKFSGHDLVLQGSLQGELTLTGLLRCAAGSRLHARVRAEVVELEGEFEGEIRATALRVSAGARARGTFIADRLSIEEGALLDGDVQAPATPVVAGAAADPLPEAVPAPVPASVADAEAAAAEPGAEPTVDETAMAATPA
jgi:cytoskeletal protein CcmA (bactofilin family)